MNQSKISALFVWDFMKSNHGLEILDVQKGELFQEKMNYISSTFQILAEFQNVMWHIAKKTSSYLTLTDDIKSMRGELVMIYELILFTHKNSSLLYKNNKYFIIYRAWI
ncbi:hypothetical protein VP01_1937g1 [Puccinia sorghi]|uniref:Uncharacterized protein n=1 Tax=Puccinia sorghi TaxID=27349 RepID=A0A0L6VCG9_9BASI|nr:hypothetical protein VP01_1937g1 [Puccinia sorghi]